MIAHNGARRDHNAVSCSICLHGPAVMRVVIVDPLVGAVTTFVCSDCSALNDRAVASIVQQTPRLQVHRLGVS